MKTVKELYEYAKSFAWSDDEKMQISGRDLALAVAYAESIGVRAGHDQHSAAIKNAREKARKLRYRYLVESILPSSDYLYDCRYADATEFGDWEVGQ